MNNRIVPLVLTAALAVACRSDGDHPQDAQAPMAKPAAEAKAEVTPALPILVHTNSAPEAAQQPAAAAPVTRDERVAALVKDHEEAMNAYYEAIEKALGDNQNPTQEDWKKIQETVKEPDAQVYLARARALLGEDATDLPAFKTIQWMFDNARDPAVTKEALGLLEKYHMDRPEMADMCDRLARGDGSVLLPKLLANSPHAEVRGRACFAMAEGLKSDIEMADYVKGKSQEELDGMKGWLSDEKLASLKALDVEKTQKEIEQIYERVGRDFPDVKLYAGTKRETTLGKRAAAELHEIHDLAVGKPAPEIEGVDLDSVSFKLSDYRGKVVLLDFWGNW